MKRALNQVRGAAAISFAAAGVAMSGFVAHGLNEAGKFELAMKNVQIATGASAAQMRQLQRQAITLSGATSQDVTQIAREQARAASSGLTTDQVMKMMPQIAAYADVQMRAHGQDPILAVKEAIQEAHLLRAYGDKKETFRGNKVTDLQAMLEYMNQISFAQPEEQGKIITQSGYFAVQARQLGMSIQQIMDVIATMGQTGLLKGKGGTGMAQLINGVINTVALTGHRQKAQTEGLRGLGIIGPNGKPVYVDDKGHIIFTKMLDHLIKVSDHTKPNVFYQMLKAAFHENGGRFAAVIANRETRDQMDKTRSKMAHIPTIKDSQEQYLEQFLVSIQLLRTNISTALATLFLPLAQRLTPYIRKVANEVMVFAQYMFDHPDLGLKVSLGLIGAAALSFGSAATIAMRQVYTLVASLRTLAAAAAETAAVNNVSAGASLVGGRGGAAASAAGKVGIMERIGGWVLKVADFFTAGLASVFVKVASWLIAGRGFIALSNGFLSLAIKTAASGGALARLTPLLWAAAVAAERFAGLVKWGVLALTPFLMSGGPMKSYTLQRDWEQKHDWKPYDGSDKNLNHQIRQAIREEGQDPRYRYWDWTGGKDPKKLAAEAAALAHKHAPIQNINSDAYNKAVLDKFHRDVSIPTIAPATIPGSVTSPGSRNGSQATAPAQQPQVNIQRVEIKVTGEHKNSKQIARDVAAEFTNNARFYTRTGGNSLLDPFGINVAPAH